MSKTRPQDGDTNWGVKLNEHLAQTLSENGGINTSDTDPTLASDDAGYTFINTTTNELKQWDGSSWVILLQNVSEANAISYENLNSGLNETNVQGAIDELYENLGEPYVKINNQINDTLPVATGIRSIAIGPSSRATGLGAVGIGNNAISGGDNGIAIGYFAGQDTLNPRGIAIGYNCRTSQDSTTIGSEAKILGGTGNIECVAIGSNSLIDNDQQSLTGGSIVIGHGATIAPSTPTHKSIAIGYDANAQDGNHQIAIGQTANTSAYRAIAIGDTAVATGESSIQLGFGTNIIANTLQFLNTTIANSESIQLKTQNTGSAPNSTPPDGTMIVDQNGTGILWIRVNGTWRSATLT